MNFDKKKDFVKKLRAFQKLVRKRVKSLLCQQKPFQSSKVT